MTEETKTPQAGEWWSDAGEIVFIIGRNSCGNLTYERAGLIEEMTDESELITWHHEPRCDSFDWTAPPAIDPGEGWELLPVGTIREEGDQLTRDRGESWEKTVNEGFAIHPETSLTYRRRKPAEWPKYVVCDKWVLDAYIRRDSAKVANGIKLNGNSFRHPYEWSEFEDGLISQGVWRYVTEAEALARVTKPGTLKLTPVEEMDLSDKPQDRTPDNRPARDILETVLNWLYMDDPETATEIAQKWLDDNPEDPPPFAKPFTNPRSGMGIRKEPVESPDDWVVQDRVPARPGIDERRYLYSDGDKSEWEDASRIQWGRPAMHGAKIGEKCYGRLELRCRRRDLPAASGWPEQFAAVTTAIRELKAPKRIPVRLGIQKNGVVFAVKNPLALDEHEEVFIHADGFYVTEGD